MTGHAVRAFYLAAGLGLSLCMFLFFGPAARAQESVSVPTGEMQEAGSSQQVAEGVSSGLRRGICWWADLDAGAIAALPDLGADTVVFRLGQLTVGPSGQGGPVRWKVEPDFSKLAQMPRVVGYRPVIETDGQFWAAASAGEIRSFLRDTVVPTLVSTGLTIRSVELRLHGEMRPMWDAIRSLVTDIKEDRLPFPIVLGIDPEFGPELPDLSPTHPVRFAEGLVVYLTGEDLNGSSPKTVDRAAVDRVAARINYLSVPFSIVLPVVNRAFLYPGSGAPTMLPAVDLALLGQFSEVRPLGAAGTEYLVMAAIPGAERALSPGDRVLVVKSLEGLDLKKTLEELPSLAPNLQEIDLFRFPLVPGFDPSPSEAFASAGWLAQERPQTTDPLQAQKAALDQKYARGQQFIMIMTFALMALLLFRMMGKVRSESSESAKK